MPNADIANPDGRWRFVLLGFAVIMLVGLGQRDLWNPDEVRVSGLVAEMALTGDFIVPRLNGEPFLEKPPLYFWLTALAYRIFGISELTARLVSALFAIAAAMLVYGLARRMGYSVASAFFSGIALATSGNFFHMGRNGVIDIQLAVLTFASLAAFYVFATESKHNKKRANSGLCARRGDLDIHQRLLWYAAFVLVLSGAVLTKGLVGLAVVVMALGAWLVLSKRFTLSIWFGLGLGCVMSLIPTGIWLLFLYNELGYDGVYEVVWTNNVGRFSGSYTHHVRPFYYYLTTFPPEFLPWTFFLPYAFWYHLKQAREENGPSRFLLAWLFAPLLLLSISSGKRGIYFLPMYPAAALLVGTAIGETLRKTGDVVSKWLTVPIVILRALVFVIPLAFLGIAIYHKESVWTFITVSVPLLLIAGAPFFRRKHLSAANSLVAIIASLVFCMGYVGAWAMPSFNYIKSHVDLFADIAAMKADGVEVVAYKPTENFRGATWFYNHEGIEAVYGREALQDIRLTRPDTVIVTDKKFLKGIEIRSGVRFRSIGHRTYVFVTAADFQDARDLVRNGELRPQDRAAHARDPSLP